MTEIAPFSSVLDPIPAFTGAGLPTDLREQMTKDRSGALTRTVDLNDY
jgi:hypothetical protein